MNIACAVDDAELEARGWKAFIGPGGRPSIIIKSDGDYRAFVNKCPHAAGEVYPITTETGEARLKCNQHGSLFDLSGSGLTGPAAGMNLRLLQLTIQEGVIYYE